MPSRGLVPEQSSRKRGRASDRSTSISAPEKLDISGSEAKSDGISTAGRSGVAGNSKGNGGISFLSTPIKPKAAAPSSSSSSSNHKPRSSFSSTFFSSSPSLLWRRGPELESSVPTMSSSVKQRGKSGAGKGGDGQGSSGGDTSASSSSAGGGAKRVSRSPQFWQKNYLVAYNLVSGVLWAMILVRVLLLYPVVGAEHVYDGMGEFVKWVQTGAVLEIVHSLIGLVRAPLFTTLMQVSSRLLLVWPVVWRHAAATAPSRFYSSMLVAWSVTEVIRYGYFVMQLKGGGRPGAVPRALVWLRYNTFFVLYPLGITSEVVMVWRASVAGRDETPDAEAYALWAVLAVYVPGSYVLYTHMMRQRRKVMGAASRPRVDSIKSAVYTK